MDSELIERLNDVEITSDTDSDTDIHDQLFDFDTETETDADTDEEQEMYDEMDEIDAIENEYEKVRNFMADNKLDEYAVKSFGELWALEEGKRTGEETIKILKDMFIPERIIENHDDVEEIKNIINHSPLNYCYTHNYGYEHPLTDETTKEQILNTLKRKREDEPEWLSEIRCEQQKVNNCIPSKPFYDLCEEILDDSNDVGLNFSDEAVEALQCITEDYLIDLFKNTKS